MGRNGAQSMALAAHIVRTTLVAVAQRPLVPACKHAHVSTDLIDVGDTQADCHMFATENNLMGCRRMCRTRGQVVHILHVAQPPALALNLCHGPWHDMHKDEHDVDARCIAALSRNRVH